MNQFQSNRIQIASEIRDPEIATLLTKPKASSVEHKRRRTHKIKNKAMHFPGVVSSMSRRRGRKYCQLDDESESSRQNKRCSRDCSTSKIGQYVNPQNIRRKIRHHMNTPQSSGEIEDNCSVISSSTTQFIVVENDKGIATRWVDCNDDDESSSSSSSSSSYIELNIVRITSQS